MPALRDEDSVLLAMIIDDLLVEPEDRDESWIIKAQNPDVFEVAKEIYPGWLARLCAVFAWFDTRKEAKRIRAVLPIAVEQGLLTTSTRDNTVFYSATDAGRKWCEDRYAELGRSQLADEDPQTRLINASRLCRILADHGSDMEATELQNGVFPPADWDTEGRPGQRAQQEAHNASIPAAFELTVSTATEEGWITRTGDRYSLTDSGSTKGAVYFDDWR